MKRACVAAVLSCAGVCLGQDGVHRGDGWSFRVPEGWTRLSDGQIAAADAMLKRANGSDDSSYVGGYADPIGEGGAYMLIQINHRPFRNVTEKQVAEAHQAAMGDAMDDVADKLRKNTDGLIGDVSMDRAVYDPEKRRVVFDMGMEIDGEPARAIVVMYPGNSQGVQLNWYAPVSEIEALRPVFMEAADSFRWDQGQEWTPGSGFNVGRSAAIGAVVGGVTAAVAAGLVRRRRERAGGAA